MSSRLRPSILPDQSLYLMQNHCGLIKVGRSINPEYRRRTLERAEECRIVLIHAWPGQGKREEELHFLLGDFRRAGEWFDGGDSARAAVAAAVMLEEQPFWPFAYDSEAAEVWLSRFLDRQDERYVQREISRAHGRIRRIDEPGWVWDAVMWDLYCLMEYGVRPYGVTLRDELGDVVQLTWVEGLEIGVPRYTSDLNEALSFWPDEDRPSAWTGSVLECCKAAVEARRNLFRWRMGYRQSRPNR